MDPVRALADASGPSQAPAYGLAGCLIAAVLLAAIAVWLWLRIRRHPGTSPRVVVAALAGTAALFVALFVAGQLNYGGTTTVSARVSAPTCASWWQEISQPAGSPGVPGDYNSTCRHAAIEATAPAIAYSVLIGVVVTGVLFAALRLGWQRRQRASERPPERYVE